MKLLLIFYLLFFYFVKKSQSQVETIRPKYLNSSIITKGQQVLSTINPHEILVYQFETEHYFNVYFRGIEKKL